MALVKFDTEMLTSMIKHVMSVEMQVEKFGKAGLSDIDSCGLKGGGQEKEIMKYREGAEVHFKEIQKFIASVKEALIVAAKDFEGFDAQAVMKKVAGQLQSVNTSGQVEQPNSVQFE